MGVKHRKTRKQKIIADYRHQIYSLENKSSTFSHETFNSHEKNSVSGSFKKVLDKNVYPSENINSQTALHADKPSYSYILRDVSKTLILTLALIGSQIILFFLLIKRILSIPYLNY